MIQGYISNNEWTNLSDNERKSLQAIRDHFNKQTFKTSQLDYLKLIDNSYEAMGKPYRDRINQKISKYGRYQDTHHDGVFLIIQSAIHDYKISKTLFLSKKSEVNNFHNEFNSDRKKVARDINNSIQKLNTCIQSLENTAILTFENEKLQEAKNALNQVDEALNNYLNEIASLPQPQTSVENFLFTVCNSLMWFGGIKLTRAITSSTEKSPLLRFLEVFYPNEAQQALSSLYEKQKRSMPENKLGTSFIPT